MDPLFIQVVREPRVVRPKRVLRKEVGGARNGILPMFGERVLNADGLDAENLEKWRLPVRAT